MIRTLKGRRDTFSALGYREVFCRLCVDMATVARTEYIIPISISFISQDSGDLKMFTLLTRAFCGAYQETDVVRVIKEVRHVTLLLVVGSYTIYIPIYIYILHITYFWYTFFFVLSFSRVDIEVVYIGMLL